MRMWMVDPKLLCRKHLLGEHVEVHMLAGSLLKGRSIEGFLAKGILEPQNVEARHARLATELLRRGYRHASPLESASTNIRGAVDTTKSLQDLRTRCVACRALQERRCANGD